MILLDVNVLVYAHRREAPEHKAVLAWLEATAGSETPFALSELALAAFVRIVTNPRIFKVPSTLDQALAFVERLRGRPGVALIWPGARHWEIFTRLCREADAKGGLVSDAYFAALAIESGCTFITADRDYARFPGLRWRHPLE